MKTSTFHGKCLPQSFPVASANNFPSLNQVVFGKMQQDIPQSPTNQHGRFDYRHSRIPDRQKIGRLDVTNGSVKNLKEVND